MRSATHSLVMHLKGLSDGQRDSPAHSDSSLAQYPLGQVRGLSLEQPLKCGHLALQIPSSHLSVPSTHVPRRSVLISH